MIFFLSNDPDEAVQWLSDADVIRMPIEITQVLMEVWQEIKPGKFTKVLADLHSPAWVSWIKESQANYVELWNYGLDLTDEHFHRFGSRIKAHPYRHSMTSLLNRLETLPPLPQIGLTDMPTSSPEATRLNYRPSGSFGTYTNRDTPPWMIK